METSSGFDDTHRTILRVDEEATEEKEMTKDPTKIKFNPSYGVTFHAEGYAINHDKQHKGPCVVGHYYPFHVAGYKSKALYITPAPLALYDQKQREAGHAYPRNSKERDQHLFAQFMPGTTLVQSLASIDKQAQHYRINLTPFQAFEFAHRHDNSLIDIFQDLDQAIPPANYEETNDNFGTQWQYYGVGREYTRVIYLDLPTAYMHEPKFKNFDDTIQAIGKKYHADECDTTQEPASFKARIWWD